MSKIVFTFDDLCALFSKYPDRLMVGMIATEEEPPEHRHRPYIAIQKNGELVREYRGWEQVHGDIQLLVYPHGEPMRRYVPHSPTDPRRSFDLVTGLDQLHPGEPLEVDLERCRAKLYFTNGELFALHPHTAARFADLETGESCPHGPTDIAVDAGLEVQIPSGGQAWLHFRSDTEDFCFKDGADYEVLVSNRAQAITSMHFQYFYHLLASPPPQRWHAADNEPQGVESAATPR